MVAHNKEVHKEVHLEEVAHKEVLEVLEVHKEVLEVHMVVLEAHKEVHPVEEALEVQVALMEDLVVLEALDLAHKLVMEVHKEDLEDLEDLEDHMEALIEEDPNNMVQV